MFENLERKYSWGVIGAMLAVLFGVPGLYALLHDTKASVAIEILADSNVLDVKRTVQDLSILFQGEDIEKNNLALRVITLRVSNDGGGDILQGQFDVSEDWGVRISTGRIVSVKLINTNSLYLGNHIDPRILDPRFIRFNKVIFERNRAFTLELLVLHPKREVPLVALAGKIAGIEWAAPVRVWEDRIATPFWTQVLSGGIGVHLVRSLLYLFLMILCGIAFASVASVYEDVKEKRDCARRLEALKEIGIADSSFAAKVFIGFGAEGVNRLLNVSKDPRVFARAVSRNMHTHLDLSKVDREGIRIMGSRILPLALIELLKSEQVIVKGKDFGAHLKPEAVVALEELMRKVEENDDA